MTEQIVCPHAESFASLKGELREASFGAGKAAIRSCEMSFAALRMTSPP